MLKKFSPLIGLLIFIIAILLIFKIKAEEKKAAQRDDKKKVFAIVGEDTPPSCNWEVAMPDRVMTENTTQAIIVETFNPNKKDCETYLSLRSPGFNIQPAREEQKINLEPNKKGSISWIITPQKSGNFEITLSDIINTKILGINVTNMFGLSAFQAKILSVIGSLFGPMFTIPWWWDRFKKRRPENI